MKPSTLTAIKLALNRRIALLVILAGMVAWQTSAQSKWLPTGPAGGPYALLAVDPNDPNIIYVGNSSPTSEVSLVYKSIDGGKKWTFLRPPPMALQPWRQTVFALNKDTLYIAGSELFKSSDGGINWVSVPTTAVGAIADLVVDPLVSSILYATSNTGSYKSLDSGKTWNRLSLPLRNGSSGSFVIDLKRQGNLYAVFPSIGVFRSTDAGGHWSSANQGLPQEGSRVFVFSVAINPVDSYVMYASTAKGIFRSTDSGVNWQADKPNSSNPQFFLRLETVPGDESTVYGLANDGVYISTDKAQSWRLIHAIHNPAFRDPYRNWLAVANRSTVFALLSESPSEAFEPFKTVDGGRTWIDISHGIFNNEVLMTEVGYSPGEIYAGTNNGILFRSADRGQSWMRLNHNQPFWPGVRSLLTYKDDRSVLWLGTQAGLFQSRDGGASFSRVDAIPPAAIISMSFSPSDDQTIYVCAAQSGIYKSTDGGKNWTEANNGLGAPLVGPYSVIVSHHDPSELFVAGRGVFKSINGGINWTSVNIGVEDTAIYLKFDPTDERRIYAGLAIHGLYVSYDGGASWTPINNGLSGNALYSRAIAVDPTNNNRIYRASFGGGVWFSNNGGLNWNDITQDLPTTDIGTLTLQQKRLYAGTEGASVFVLDVSQF